MIDWNDLNEKPRLSPKRLGRITASGIYSLMVAPRSKTETLSETAKKYLMTKVAERLTGVQEEEYTNIAMQYGLDMEAPSLDVLATELNVGLAPVEFVEYGTIAGCTPDAKVIGLSHGVEIKNPYTTTAYLELTKITNQVDFKKSHPQYYWQCMTSLLFTGYDQ